MDYIKRLLLTSATVARVEFPPNFEEETRSFWWLGSAPLGHGDVSLTGVNVTCGPAVERVLLTGLHAVADIKCECCETILGWKYEHAFESSQKYKEGKFIIELAHMIKDNGWE
ncbi:hypothetical protein RRG08_016187 [Elysia crispata]|uniref:Protein yippee-like n=1 Tax=Elysia crispata TaxID=231223 RepID=A0AAE1DKU3_9GAST|nr:hypothetical protein RRG08_016187 [Elysia crispata]